MADTQVSAPSAPSNNIARTPLSDAPGAFRIGALVDPMRKRYIKALFYGAPGTGKTTLAGSAVDLEPMRDVLLLQFEGGQEVLLDNDRIQNPELVDMIRIKRIEQLQKIYEFLLHHCRFRDSGKDADLEKLQLLTFGYANADGSPMEKLPEGDRLRKYHTVVLDSLTEMEAQNLAVALKLDSVGVENAGEVEKAGWDEFRLNNHTVQRIVRAFRDLDMNVILICAQRYDQDEMKRYHYSPALTGKLTTQIQGFVDVVGWLVAGQDAEGKPMRRLAVQPQIGPKADAKSRFAMYTEPHFDNPVMKDLMIGFGLITQSK
jgi:hypothetical protein